MGQNKNSNRKTNRSARGRVIALLVICALVFALFLARLVYMQFVQAEHYAAQVAAASTTSYTVAVPAARGDITDRTGTVLATDTVRYSLGLCIPAPPGQDYAATIAALEKAGIIDPDSGGKDVETQLAAFLCVASAGVLPLAQDLSSADAAALYAGGLVQSGAVRLTAQGERSWPQGRLLAHSLGFTGAVTAAQWQEGDYALRAAGVAMDAEIGQSGLELAYDALLRGQDGLTRITSDYGGAVLQTEVLRQPQPGATLQLTIDADLQQLVQTALQAQLDTLRTTKAPGKGAEASAGAAVVVEVASGAVLAAASLPDYDPNSYRSDYAALAADSAAPLLNRVCSGLYAPGSAFKPAVAAAALAAGTISPSSTVYCGGRYTFYPAYQPGCLQLGHSGAVDLAAALKYSCNIYFYDVGRRLGVDGFSAAARLLGLAADTGAELPGAAGALTWQNDQNYQAGLVLQAAIGQGNTAVTPLQLAAYATALARDGEHPTLHFAERALNTAGETVWQYPMQTAAIAPGGEAVFAPIKAGMTEMAQTLSVLREAPVTAACKTGSPQLPTTLPDGSHYTNSVLIAFAPAQTPQIAVAVVLEQGGGGANAAPVLRAILDAAPLWLRQ